MVHVEELKVDGDACLPYELGSRPRQASSLTTPLPILVSSCSQPNLVDHRFFPKRQLQQQQAQQQEVEHRPQCQQGYYGLHGADIGCEGNSTLEM